MNKHYYIYVVLTQTGTNVAKIIKLFTGAPYNHASITTDVELNEMFSFARMNLHRPLPAGFIREKTDAGIFNLFKNIPCEVYGYKVTYEQYQEYTELIEEFKEKTNHYSYNVLGLFALALGIPILRKNKFVCSHFVAYILNEIGIADFKKNLCLVKPDDLRHLKNAVLLYRGDFKSLKANKVSPLQKMEYAFKLRGL